MYMYTVQCIKQLCTSVLDIKSTPHANFHIGECKQAVTQLIVLEKLSLEMKLD